MAKLLTFVTSKEKSKHPWALSISTFIFTFVILSIVQLKVKNPMILLERFIEGGGWVEIFLISSYASFVVWKMHDAKNVPSWRRNTWLLFSIVFFTQLALGILGFEKFLMTGNLHLPVPGLIVTAPIYRVEIGFMAILFLSTVLLSGPSWCSQLCYFGALDNLSAKGKTKKGSIKNGKALKATLFVIVVLTTILLRLFNISSFTALIIASSFGVVGICVILFISRKSKKMMHCTTYCPVGTTINYLKFLNPFRMYIDSSCTLCTGCISYCKYDALNLSDIKNGKPGINCTYCGDCVGSCHSVSIKYKFFGFSSETARNLYLFITISLHAIFLALARI